jgi:hypothetical protein
LVRRLESSNVVCAEVTVHGAGEKNRELSEQLGVLGDGRVGKAIQVKKVTRVATVDHSFRLSTEQFFECENHIPTWALSPYGRSIQFLRRKSTGSHQTVDLHLDAIWPASVICEIEIPLERFLIVESIVE